MRRHYMYDYVCLSVVHMYLTHTVEIFKNKKIVRQLTMGKRVYNTKFDETSET